MEHPITGTRGEAQQDLPRGHRTGWSVNMIYTVIIYELWTVFHKPKGRNREQNLQPVCGRQEKEQVKNWAKRK